MASRITPLRLEAFEQLPKHARRCVFWEVDPSTLSRDDHLSDPEFEKEAWLSMVMLEWGSCGQVAVLCPEAMSDEAAATDPSAEEPCVGYAFYAPPRAVPRAGLFPTGPVSADAVLLTTVGAEQGDEAAGLPHTLLTSVVGDLVRRGVRALEAFGRTEAVTELLDPGRYPRNSRRSWRPSVTVRCTSAWSRPTSWSRSGSPSSPRTATSPVASRAGAGPRLEG